MASRTFARMSALRASGRLSQLATILARSAGRSRYTPGTHFLCTDVSEFCADLSDLRPLPSVQEVGKVLSCLGFARFCVGSVSEVFDVDCSPVRGSIPLSSTIRYMTQLLVI